MCEGGSRNRRAPVELESYALRQRGLELYVITKTHGYSTMGMAIERGLGLSASRIQYIHGPRQPRGLVHAPGTYFEYRFSIQC